MDDPGGIILKLILLLLLILVNAFFAMSEIAVISLNDNKIEKMAEDGHKKAKQVVKLTENSSKFLSTIQIGVTLAGFLTSASASQTFADMIVNALEGTAFYNALGASVVSGLSIVIITIIMSYFSLVLGELAPKKIAMQSPERSPSRLSEFCFSSPRPFHRLLKCCPSQPMRSFDFSATILMQMKSLLPKKKFE